MAPYLALVREDAPQREHDLRDRPGRFARGAKAGSRSHPQARWRERGTDHRQPQTLGARAPGGQRPRGEPEAVEGRDLRHLPTDALGRERLLIEMSDK